MQTHLRYIICRDCGRVFIFEDDAQDHRDQKGHQSYHIREFDDIFKGGSAARLRLVLQQAIIASLKSLGERAMNSVIWHLSSNNILIDSDNLEIRKFYESLQEIIGPSADAIMESVIRQLLFHYKVEAGKDLSEEVDSLSDSSPDERLLYMVKMILGLQGRM